MSGQKIALLGELADKKGVAARMVRKVGMQPIGVEDWRAEREVFHRLDVVGVVFHAGMPDFEQLCVELRSELDGNDLPLIAVVDEEWDPRLERLFMFSIDDYVVADNFESLEPKLLALGRGNPWTNLSPTSGRVVVADPDRKRRVLYGRMLRRKGLGVEFAADKDEVLRAAEAPDVRLILSSAELPPDGAAAAIRGCRVAGSKLASLPWVVEGDPSQLEALEKAIGDAPALRLFNRDDPPESVLFLIGELLSQPQTEARQSPRLLYGAPAAFRIVGSRHRVPCFTYNINRTGLFLRTLVPPPRESDLIVDVRPPHGEGWVRVYGRVVWRKECAQQGGPVAPTGMGLIYTRVPLADGAALEAGYEALLGAAPGRRTSVVKGLGAPSPEPASGESSESEDKGEPS